MNIWCERVDHATRLAKQIDRENFGICFNLYHWLRTDPDGDLRAVVREAMPHLFLVTVNGELDPPQGPGGLPLGHGGYDVAEFLQPFVEAGYRGPVGLQAVFWKGDVRENLRQSLRAWNEISSRLAGAAGPAGEEHPE